MYVFIGQVSDDEVIVSECELQDLSITPLLNALHAHKTFAVLDFSHNLLGNDFQLQAHLFSLCLNSSTSLQFSLH